MKSKFGRISSFIIACFFIGMACVTVCLMAEYRYFKQQVHELVELRNYYQTCIQVLKQQISYSEYKNCQDPVSEKKSAHELETGPQPRFLVVNREPEYLKREALKFARSHNLEQPLRSLYEKPAPKKSKQPAVPQKSPKKQPSQSNNRPTKKIARVPVSKNKQVAKSKPHKSKLKKIPVRWAQAEQSARAAQLKKERFFAWPLDRASFWMSSPFGPRRNPNGSMGFHAGTDLAAVRGTPVKAAASGMVSQAIYHKGYGNMVLTVSPGKAKVRYAHLDSIRVRVGQHVKQGDVIGTVGNTGNVRRKRGRDGSHLHLEIYVSDDHASFKRVDPLYFLT